DGALTPHNNPSLYMFLLATLPQFGLRWPIGPDNLTIVSVGTGSSYLHKMTMRDARWTRALGIAVHSLASLMSDSQQFESYRIGGPTRYDHGETHQEWQGKQWPVCPYGARFGLAGLLRWLRPAPPTPRRRPRPARAW